MDFMDVTNDVVCHFQVVSDVAVDPSLKEKAPTWVPDSSVHYCMHCQRIGVKKKFGKLVRKVSYKLASAKAHCLQHHCRHCGDVVCKNCSGKKFILQKGTKAVRVCDACYLQLVKKGVQGGRRVHSEEAHKGMGGLWLACVGWRWSLLKVYQLSFNTSSDEDDDEDESEALDIEMPDHIKGLANVENLEVGSQHGDFV